MRINEKNYTDKAEQVILKLKEESKKSIVTTSKIRNILAMSAEIYNNVLVIKEDKLSNELQGKIQYLKIRMIYDAGRDKDVKALIEKAELLACLKEIGDSKENFILFQHYLEAIVAYRKFHVEKDE